MRMAAEGWRFPQFAGDIGSRVAGGGLVTHGADRSHPQPATRHTARSAPGFPFSTTNVAAVSTGAPGRVTYGTIRESLVQRSGVSSQRTDPGRALWYFMV